MKECSKKLNSFKGGKIWRINFLYIFQGHLNFFKTLKLSYLEFNILSIYDEKGYMIRLMRMTLEILKSLNAHEKLIRCASYVNHPVYIYIHICMYTVEKS